MSPDDLTRNVHQAINEIMELSEVVSAASLEQIRTAVVNADKVFLTGAGRSGLVSRAIAMRLMHIGLRSFATGEVATPAIGTEDLLIAFSARGGTSTVAQMATAKSVGATVAAFTAAPDTPVAEAADLVVVIPARTKVASAQHAGSLFEQTCLIIGDALCRGVQETLGVPAAELNRRHANLT